MRTPLSIVIPFYNEEKNIESVLSEIKTALSGMAIPYEFICVDNGSRDTTAAILTKFAHQDPHITIITVPVNEGYGWGVSRGLAATTKPWVTVVSGDRQIDPRDILNAYAIMESSGVDIVKSRRISRSDGPYRFFISFTYNLIMKILFQLPGWDYNAPPKIFKQSFLKRIQIESKTSFIDPEILIKAKRLGASMTEITSTYREREHGSGHTNIHTIGTFIADIIYWRFFR